MDLTNITVGQTIYIRAKPFFYSMNITIKLSVHIIHHTTSKLPVIE